MSLSQCCLLLEQITIHPGRRFQSVCSKPKHQLFFFLFQTHQLNKPSWAQGEKCPWAYNIQQCLPHFARDITPKKKKSFLQAWQQGYSKDDTELYECSFNYLQNWGKNCSQKGSCALQDWLGVPEQNFLMIPCSVRGPVLRNRTLWPQSRPFWIFRSTAASFARCTVSLCSALSLLSLAFSPPSVTSSSVVAPQK